MSEAVFDLSPAAITDANDRKIEHMREKQPHLTHRVRRTLERASRKFGVSTAALARMRERHHAKLKAQEIDVGHGNGRPGSEFATEKDKRDRKRQRLFFWLSKDQSQ
jgi:hypothetical protein